MNDERAGYINEPNLLTDIADEILFHCAGRLDRNTPRVTPVAEQAAVGVVNLLRRRGLINELGIEILKRDGVIPPVSPDHSKP
jgi:hypothetical protein